MNYHELQYILCIAKHQNLTKAAQELYISQPTLTKHLQKLEREMGTKLFSRSERSFPSDEEYLYGFSDHDLFFSKISQSKG